MSLRQKLKDDMKTSMKAGEKQKTSVLRMLLSELQYAETSMDSREGEMPDQEVLRVVESYFKRLRKSLDDYPEGEKREQILFEMSVVEAYIPAKASEETVIKTIDEVLNETEERNFGILMKSVMGKLGKSADGKIVNQLLRAKLQN